jgi:ribosomal protein L40E
VTGFILSLEASEAYMQSSQEIFCEECGAANPGDATHCFACHELLSHSPASLPAPAPVVPVRVAPAPVLQVTVAAALATTPNLAAASEDTLKPGTLMQGRYRIHSEIGRGGYSVVYKAVDTTHRNNLVSIKQINLRNLTSRQAIEATETFNRETTLLPILRHTGIPRFYGHFTDPEHWYLVMEYIPGQTLENYLQSPATGGSFSLVETLKIGIALGSVLEYLHLCKPPLIFRDVKPGNVMLTPRKKLYLIDFGIARSFHPAKSKDTTPLGSPGFAAPEQYGRRQSDGRTDVYGLGATLQTLLTGRDPLELRAGEASRAPHPVPSHVQKLLNEMMDADPARRPRNMTIVKQRLQRALARVQRRFSYTLGLIFGLILFLWGYVNIHFLTGHYDSFGYLAVLAFGSVCIWALSLVTASITFFVFLFIPARRYISLGVLTILLLVIVLASTNVLPLFR